ncbi:hypothetical protein [Croceimicrobium hydrocarbonivorans]|uniref:Uncharacterized protein n=1 Tax=Croceimicrobium hydrocarbonivorans TaxID=2761580 RepID=A0A7H0VB77_9FLAO|nr:hypothetical protein [Croceimicrobium hydrocarbonivorans]QNR22975.1 hypothetical protein H4K34_11355 [Croceimicrobium hydrocarbonivorans]
MGHEYNLENYEGKSNQCLVFVEQSCPGDELPNSNGPLKTIQNGTTEEEVLKALLSRLRYLNLQVHFQCSSNFIAEQKLREALWWLYESETNRSKRAKYQEAQS